MGFTLYMASYTEALLVHECVHVWQFQFGGLRYIGNSVLTQLDRLVFSPGYSPYRWKDAIDGGTSWYALKSAEAQFIQDTLADGRPADRADGAFFREDADLGRNRCRFGADDHTAVANDAWRILRTG